MKPEDFIVDRDRLDAFHQACVALGQRWGFMLTRFHVEETRYPYGDLPEIDMEWQQLPSHAMKELSSS